jgi:hypothetical protein
LILPLACVALAFQGETAAAVVGLAGASIGAAVVTSRRGVMPV